jgi:hypothetical protein
MQNPNIEVFKPTAVQEKWYGFDQSYISTGGRSTQVINEIKDFIHQSKAINTPIYQAVFLQFKVVDRMQRSSVRKPPSFVTPYYRSELYLDRNKDTGLSQHETLLRLSGLMNSETFYVCPMIFSIDDIRKPPRSSDLRFVDVKTSPAGWVTTEKHSICFQDILSSPFWCSDPTPGESLSWRQVVERLPDLTEDELYALITEARNIGLRLEETRKSVFQAREAGINPTPSSLVVFAREA